MATISKADLQEAIRLRDAVTLELKTTDTDDYEGEPQDVLLEMRETCRKLQDMKATDHLTDEQGKLLIRFVVSANIFFEPLLSAGPECLHEDYVAIHESARKLKHLAM